MAGVLQFTLGLETSQFLGALGLAHGQILSFAAVGEALHKVMDKMFESFERGGALVDLSKRTGESVGTLYQLEEAFKACGASAESLPGMLFMMQKALGGVSETGESTADVFHKLGLNAAELKNAGPAAALEQILGRMGGMSQESAVKVSSMIFGRMGAGQAVQMSRSSEEFREAFADAARQAAIFGRAEEAFERINRTVGAIKREFVGFWAGLAEGAAPAVQSILDWLKKIDLTGLGIKIGSVLQLLTESFKDGTFSEMLALSLQVGFEKGAFWAERFALTLGTAVMASLPHAIKASLELGRIGARSLGEWSQKFGIDTLQESVDRGKKRKYADPGRWSDRDERLLGIDERDLGIAQGQLANMQEEFRAKNAAAMRVSLQEGQAAIDEAIKMASGVWATTGAGAPSDAQKRLSALLGRFGNAMGGGDGKYGGGGSNVDFGKGLLHKTEGNAFEKMGFNMGGAGGPIQDVVKNTGRTADAIDQLREVILYNQSHCVDPGLGEHPPL